MKKNNSSEERKSELTPLIDVVFLLLIFFLVTLAVTGGPEQKAVKKDTEPDKGAWDVPVVAAGEELGGTKYDYTIEINKEETSDGSKYFVAFFYDNENWEVIDPEKLRSLFTSYRNVINAGNVPNTPELIKAMDRWCDNIPWDINNFTDAEANRLIDKFKQFFPRSLGIAFEDLISRREKPSIRLIIHPDLYYKCMYTFLKFFHEEMRINNIDTYSRGVSKDK